MTVLSSPSTNNLLALAAVMAGAVLPAVETLESSPTTRTATEQQLLIKAPDATCPYGAIACCNSDVPVCTLQPTACVDNYLHPASILCTGNCPGDDMTLKCTADMNSQCRLAHVATPIAYFEKPIYEGVQLHRSKESDQEHLATLDQVVSGWFCAQLETNTDIVSEYNEVSTLGQSEATSTESIATETSSSSETDTTETQSAPYWNDPSSPVDPPPVDAGQEQIGFPGNEDCYWVDEYGNCCDPSEGGYYRPKRQLKGRRSQFEGVEMDEALTSAVSKPHIVTYMHSTTIPRLMTTFTPVQPPVKPIVEAIYIVLNTYENETDPVPLREATMSHTILLYTDKHDQTSEMAKPTRSHPSRPRPRPTASNKGDPRAGMKAGIAIGAIILIALVLFVVLRCRSLRKAKRANLRLEYLEGYLQTVSSELME
ncbi:hypothetical protein N0V82_002486 [Gnomoniopsis sp. IMI 355080]|nr:hypothetical protein N0V82_002486 [Gnomoniopsis sp. IMI 355080]